MTCWAIIPIKDVPSGKSRLAGVLDPAERARLISAMLAHVVAAAQAATGITRVFLVGPSRHGMDETMPLLADPGDGLNAAVASALAEVVAHAEAPHRVIVIAADLPVVTPRDLDLLVLAPIDAVAIAPDRHGIGTNALSLPLPAGRNFTFAFGPDSLLRHQEEAERLGLRVETILSHGLERDIDEPADLADARQVLASENLPE
ncbi:MAG TPA: 2-phospho-L-lactate guanylyltransferase [Novosphingobium sp.]|nr:2-phospho-L-lactate guanylyltransferase [Novosphingobium sp.]